MAKYDDLLEKLNNDELYSAGSIVALARETAYMTEYNGLLRIRITLNARAARASFVSQSDGWVKLPRQSPTLGWYGWRWKGLIGKRHKSADES